MPQERLEKIKTKMYENWDNMAKMVKNPNAKITGGDVPKFISNALKPAEGKWERVLKRGSLDFQPVYLDNQYRYDKYSALRKAIDKSPDDPLAQKALIQLLAMEKEVNAHYEAKEVKKKEERQMPNQEVLKSPNVTQIQFVPYAARFVPHTMTIEQDKDSED